MKRIARFAATLLALTLLAGVCSFAYAADEITVSAENRTFNENNGTLSMTVKVNNTTSHELVLAAIQPSGGAVLSATATGTIPKRSEIAVNVAVVLKSSGSTSSDLTFLFNYVDDDGSTQVVAAQCAAATYTIARMPTPDATDAPSADDADKPEFKLRISNVDAACMAVPTPSGDYGEELYVRLPLVCEKQSVYDVKVTPVLDTDIEKFPFDINVVDYTLSYPNSVAPGNVVEFDYTWKLSKRATVGVKKVDFTVSYRNYAGELESGTVSLFVNVRKGLTATTGETTPSVPKLIIESYSLSSDKIYAGETFDLEFTVKNTSSNDNIQNIQIRVKDAAETATIVPASGGSNTMYISKISKGSTETKKLSLQTAPDAEAKAYTLNIDFSYESASTNAAHTAAETIAVPILQKIRLKCDDPVIYDEMGWLNQSCSMYVKMYNMGRSTIYNCMVNVEGQGLEMEESFFGGNLTGGSTLSADFSIIPSVAGTIDGTVVLSYEDVYGEPGEERLPFTLVVEDNSVSEEELAAMAEMEQMEYQEPSRGLPWWAWILIIAALGGGGFFGYKEWRKRRMRHLEED